MGRTYVRSMGEKTLTIDQRERQLVDDESLIARLRARQMENLAVLDQVQVATGDGSRSLSEWVSARLDVSLATARSLVRTMRRSQERPDLRRLLASGEVSFDRVEALSKISEDVGLMFEADIAGVCREAASRALTDSESESRTPDDNFLVIQPSLDESWWKLWGGLDAYSGALVDKVLAETADQLPPLPDGETTSTGWRKATALVGLCVSEEPAPAQITVFVDASQATGTNGDTGVMIEAGPKAGSQALEAILCDAVTEITVNKDDGVPMSYGLKSRTVPPASRRTILARNHGYCAVPGCNSRYRVEVHHKTPWSQGGTTDADNLVALCWFHHHIVIHQRGFEIYRHHDHGRIRFRRPKPRAEPDDPPG